MRYDLRGKLGWALGWLSMLVASVFLGCGGGPGSQEARPSIAPVKGDTNPQQSRYLTAQQLMAELGGTRSVSLQMIDVRPKHVYEDHHIPGSLHLPPRLLGRDQRTRGRDIVLVDNGVPDGAAREWARAEEGLGGSVRVLHGGMQAWCRSGGQTKGSCLKAGHLEPDVLMPGGRALEQLVWLGIGTDSRPDSEIARLLEPEKLFYATQGTLSERLEQIRRSHPYAHVVLFDPDGKQSFLLQKVQEDHDLNLFYLVGGEKALLEHVTIVSASQLTKERSNKLIVITPGETRSATKPLDTFPSGCGCL